jgi:uncharacterized surface protein with fasciclin (FAS1) repeats
MKKIVFAFSFVFSVLAVQAQMVAFGIESRGGSNTNSAASRMSPQKNIIENLGSSGEHTSLVMAIQSAGLIELLQKQGPYTFFAPSNESFTKLMQGNISSTDEDKKKLNRLIKSHIVSGRLDANALIKMIKEADGKASLTTLSGDVLQVTKKGKKILLTDPQGKQSTIVSSDIEQNNGLIHIIDKVFSL